VQHCEQPPSAYPAEFFFAAITAGVFNQKLLQAIFGRLPVGTLSAVGYLASLKLAMSGFLHAAR